MNDRSRAPRSFDVDDDDRAKRAPDADKPAGGAARAGARRPRAFGDDARIALDEEDFFEREALDEAAPPPPIDARRARGRGRLGTIAVSAFALVVALAAGLWLERLVTALFERHPVLGQVGLAAVAVLAAAVLVGLTREILAIVRQRSVAQLRTRLAVALDAGDGREIASATEALEVHLGDHPKTAAGRARLAELEGEVIDPADRYRIAERELLSGLDTEARVLVMNAAKRVSIVTAVSPRALIDLGYVLYENVRLIRVIAEHYGGRAGTIGTVGLVRRVVSHLAVTGTIAVGDSLIQQIVGHGVAARLSARLGEGVVNGLMTARIGIAAIDVCRPAPFVALPAPRLGAMARTLTRYSAAQQGGKDAD